MSESTRGWIDLDDYDPAALDEVNRLAEELEARKDSAYQQELRDKAGSDVRIHGTELPAIRAVGRQWLHEHQLEHWNFLLSVCEILWETDSREEQLLALFFIYRCENLRDHVDWNLLSRWSTETTSPEVVDYLGAIGGLMLSRNPRLLAQITKLTTSDDSLQRLFSLVTLIVASREYSWRPALEAAVKQLAGDTNAEVQARLALACKRLSPSSY